VNYRVMSPPGTQENVGPADGGPLTTVLPTRRARLSKRGTPFVKESFGNWFRHACREEGCPGSTHGLRKAGATRAAENGATVNQLMALFGWKTEKMALLYTGKADRKHLASIAGPLLLGAQKTNEKLPHPGSGCGYE